MIRGHRRDERGSAALELVIVTVPLITVVMLVVTAGRLVAAEGTLGGAARAAARAGAAQRTAAGALAAAEAAVAADLEGSKVACDRLDVGVDTSDFRPGGTVGVTLLCEVRVADLLPLPLPGGRAVSARALAVVDVLRGAG